MSRFHTHTDFAASIAGAVASITVAAPLDVVKTRIQNANFSSTQSGMSIIRDMIKQEGMGSFFKGLTPKILVVGPKLVFSYTMAMTLIPWFGKFGEYHSFREPYTQWGMELKEEADSLSGHCSVIVGYFQEKLKFPTQLAQLFSDLVFL